MTSSRKLVVVALVVSGTAALAAVAMGFGRSPLQDADSAAEQAAQDAGAARDTAAAEEPATAQEAATPEDSLPPLLALEERSPTGMTAQEAIDAHLSATEGPEQPIPFNHRFHTQELGMQCAYCHNGAQSSMMAPIPSIELCMGCHRIVGSQLEPIQTLRGYWERGEPVPWERIHKLPDFVQFPHEAHIRNDLACSECHGEVENMDRVRQVNSLHMGWCLECHMGETQPTDYATDRILAQKFPPPEFPEGRQPVGVYPRVLDSNYGETRAPVECTACHY